MTNLQHTALITGASTGIGAAYSKLLAAQGYNLVLIARDKGKLDVLAQQLQQQYEIKTYVLPQDLSLANAALNIYNFTCKNNLHIDMLINNAGFGDSGKFLQHDIAEHNAMIQAMLSVIVQLCHYYLPAMLAENRGTIINVASVVGLLGQAMKNKVTRALYRPIKVFVIAFTQQLQLAYKDNGVNFQCLCPGLTISDFHKRTGQQQLYKTIPKFLWQDSMIVAKTSLMKLSRQKNNTVVVTGWINKFAIFIYKITSIFQ